MNRDCNIEELAYESQSGGKIVRLSDLQDWLTDKKIIKKGLQPHPYADVLHESIEMGNLQKRYQISYDNRLKTKWFDFNISISDEFRIKPSEPIYEWQFVFIQEGYQNILSEYMTDDELGNIHEMVTCIKIEETKRKRK